MILVVSGSNLIFFFLGSPLLRYGIRARYMSSFPLGPAYIIQGKNGALTHIASLRMSETNSASLLVPKTSSLLKWGTDLHHLIGFELGYYLSLAPYCAPLVPRRSETWDWLASTHSTLFSLINSRAEPQLLTGPQYHWWRGRVLTNPSSH